MRFAIAALSLLGASAPAMAVQTIHIVGSFDQHTGVVSLPTNSFDLLIELSSAGSYYKTTVTGTIGGYTLDPSGFYHYVNIQILPNEISFIGYYNPMPGFSGNFDFKFDYSSQDGAVPPSDFYKPSTLTSGSAFVIDQNGVTQTGSYSDPIITSLEAVGPTPGLYVPEPATWAMMILGFGMVDAAVRRRQSPVAA